MKRRRSMWTAIAVALLLIVGALSIAIKINEFERDAAYYDALGQERMTEGKYRQAASFFVQAISHNPQDADLYVRVGDALHHNVVGDASLRGKDHAAWVRALQIDPHNVPALRRLLDEAQAQASSDRTLLAITQVRHYADALLAVVPDDIAAEEWCHMGSVLQVLAGSGDDADIDTHCQAIRGLMRRDPANANLPACLASLELDRAGRFARDEQFDRCDDHLERAASLFAGATCPRAHNIELYLRGNTVLMNIARQSGLHTVRQLFRPLPYQPDLVDALVAAAPDRRRDVVRSAVAAASSVDDRATMEELCEREIRRDPADLESRLMIARSKATRRDGLADAIDALTLPALTQSTVADQGDMHARLVLTRLALRCAAAEDAAPPARAALSQRAWQDYREAAAAAAPASDLCVARVRIALLNGDADTALTALHDLPGEDTTDPNVQCLRARALWIKNDHAGSLSVLGQAIVATPANDAPRLLLIKQRLEVGQNAAAFACIDAFGGLPAAAPNQTRAAVAELLRRASARTPADPALRLKLVEVLGGLHPFQHDEIERLLTDAESMPVLSNCADVWHAHALLCLADGRAHEAIRLLRKGFSNAALDPKIANTLLLAEAADALQRGDRDAARTHLELALQAIAPLPRTLQRRTILMARQVFAQLPGRPVALDALRAIQSYAQANRSDLDVLCTLVRLGSMQDRHASEIVAAEAYASMRAARVFDPEVVGLYAWELIGSGRPDEALSLVRRTMLDPSVDATRFWPHYLFATLYRNARLIPTGLSPLGGLSTWPPRPGVRS